MNIYDSMAISSDEIRRQQTHVTGQTNEVDFVLLQRRHNLAIVFLTSTVPPLDYNCLQSSLHGALDTSGIWPVADHDSNRGVGRAAFANRIRQRDHVRAAT